MKGFNFGWKTGFEPATSGTTIQRSNQLSYNHHFVSECKCKSFTFFYKGFLKYYFKSNKLSTAG